MTKKQVFRTIIFFMVLGCIVSIISFIFVRGSAAGTTARFRAFYSQEKKDTWDGVLLGSSVVERAWVAPMAWEEKGLALYCMSTDSQPLVFTTKLLEEIQKKQNVDFVVVDIRGLRSAKSELKDFKIRRLTDNLRYSKKRSEILQIAFDYVEANNRDKSILEDKLSFFLPIIKYHPRWNELSMTDFVKPETAMKGVYEVSAFNVKPLETPTLTTKSGGLKESQIEVLMEIIDYGKEHNLKLLFTSMPAPINNSSQKQINQAFEIIEENGYPGINFNTAELYEELDLDFETDYYDSTHVNSRGARKVTEYLTNYITQNFEFQDKRGDPNYVSWDQAWETYESFYNNGWGITETPSDK